MTEKKETPLICLPKSIINCLAAHLDSDNTDALLTVCRVLYAARESITPGELVLNIHAPVDTEWVVRRLTQYRRLQRIKIVYFKTVAPEDLYDREAGDCERMLLRCLGEDVRVKRESWVSLHFVNFPCNTYDWSTFPPIPQLQHLTLDKCLSRSTTRLHTLCKAFPSLTHLILPTQSVNIDTLTTLPTSLVCMRFCIFSWEDKHLLEMVRKIHLMFPALEEVGVSMVGYFAREPQNWGRPSWGRPSSSAVLPLLPSPPPPPSLSHLLLLPKDEAAAKEMSIKSVSVKTSHGEWSQVLGRCISVIIGTRMLRTEESVSALTRGVDALPSIQNLDIKLCVAHALPEALVADVLHKVVDRHGATLQSLRWRMERDFLLSTSTTPTQSSSASTSVVRPLVPVLVPSRLCSLDFVGLPLRILSHCLNLSSATTLGTLRLGRIHMTAEDIRVLCSGCPRLHHLSLKNSTIDKSAVEALSLYGVPPRLHTLDLETVELGVPVYQFISHARPLCRHHTTILQCVPLHTAAVPSLSHPPAFCIHSLVLQYDRV